MRRQHNASLVCIVDVQAPSTVASRVAVQRLPEGESEGQPLKSRCLSDPVTTLHHLFNAAHSDVPRIEFMQRSSKVPDMPQRA